MAGQSETPTHHAGANWLRSAGTSERLPDLLSVGSYLFSHRLFSFPGTRPAVEQGDHGAATRQRHHAAVLVLTLVSGAVRRERPLNSPQQDPRLDQGELRAEAVVRAASERHPMARVGPVTNEPFRVECLSVGIQVGAFWRALM